MFLWVPYSTVQLALSKGPNTVDISFLSPEEEADPVPETFFF
jgi:hypothetical protein